MYQSYNKVVKKPALPMWILTSCPLSSSTFTYPKGSFDTKNGQVATKISATLPRTDNKRRLSALHNSAHKVLGGARDPLSIMENLPT